MSTEDICETKPVKRNSSDPFFQDNKRLKYEIGEPSTSFLNNDADDDLLQKYKKISTSELEDLCVRLMHYDSTGIYMPPKQNNPCLCPKKKKYYKNQHLKPRSDNEKLETKFGQGSVGVATERFGLKSSACHCCVNSAAGSHNHLVHPTNYLSSSNTHLVPGKSPKIQNFSATPQVKVENIETNFYPINGGFSNNFGSNSDTFNCDSTSETNKSYLPQTSFQNNLNSENSKSSVLQSETQLFGTPSASSTNSFVFDSAILNCVNNNKAPQNHVLSQKDFQSTQNSITTSSQGDSKFLGFPSLPLSQKVSQNSIPTSSQGDSKFLGFQSVASTSIDNFMYNSASFSCDNNLRATQGQLLPEKSSQSLTSSGHCHENLNNKMADPLPSTSAFQIKNDSLQNNPEFSKEDLDHLSAILDNTNVLDLSVSNLNQSDSSDTIFYSEDSCNSLLNGVVPPPEAEEESPLDLSSDLEPQIAAQNLTQDDVSVISVTNVRAGPESNTEIVDLTNLTPRRPIITNEVIELLDDTFQSPNPPIVETIDLVESSDEDESLRITSSVSETAQSTNSKSSLECPICFEPLRNKKIMTTICGHIFCSGCIKSAYKRKKCCPSCRKKLRATDYHPLYLNL